MIKRPNATAAAAAHRTHHRARHVSLSNALLRAAPSISAYAGVCTKLKNHSRPIHIIATTTCAMRKAPPSPALLKISIGTPSPACERVGTYQSLTAPDGLVADSQRSECASHHPK